jgi:molecular chaperone DnaK (HSP70)
MSCAIDFGTSISAIAIPDHTSSGMRLVPLKGQHRTVPTAVSYVVDRHERGGPPRAFGRAGAGVVGQVCAASGVMSSTSPMHGRRVARRSAESVLKPPTMKAAATSGEGLRRYADERSFQQKHEIQRALREVE